MLNVLQSFASPKWKKQNNPISGCNSCYTEYSHHTDTTRFHHRSISGTTNPTSLLETNEIVLCASECLACSYVSCPSPKPCKGLRYTAVLMKRNPHPKSSKGK